jgi:hypothetical protein
LPVSDGNADRLYVLRRVRSAKRQSQLRNSCSSIFLGSYKAFVWRSGESEGGGISLVEYLIGVFAS